MMQTKTCNRCGKEKPVDEFYRHPAMSDGRLNQCKECKKNYQSEYGQSDAGKEADKRKYRKHKEKILARNRAYQQVHKEEIRLMQRRWIEENFEYVQQYKRTWYAANHEEVLARVRDYNQSERGRKTKEQYEKRNPEKVKARKAVDRAVRRGKLERLPCEVCGDEAQAHHDDYSKPLDVRWLCFRHHREEHGQVVVSLALAGASVE